jgi:hypothetical protein
MKKTFLAAAALSVSLALAPTSASAFFVAPKGHFGHGFKHFHKPKFHHPKPPKPPKTASNPQQSGGKNHGLRGAGAYLMGATFCSAGFLVLRAFIVNAQENRELTRGEAWETVGGCFVPLIGGPIFRNFAESYPS